MSALFRYISHLIQKTFCNHQYPLYGLYSFIMFRLIFIPEAPADECHAKNNRDQSGISTIKYLDTARTSFLFADSAPAAYRVCLQSLNMGVIFMNPGFLINVDI